MMGKKQILHYILWLILIAAMVTELALQSYHFNEYGMYDNPIVSISSGLIVALCAFALAGFRKEEKLAWKPVLGAWAKYIIVGSVFVGGGYWCGNTLQAIFAAHPVDAELSDVIPSLELYVRRLLAGETVYRPLPFNGYSVDPTYLPLLWSPYIFSELLQIDYRWTAYTVFLIAIFCFHISLLKKGFPLLELLLKAAVPFVALHVLTLHRPFAFGVSVELLPVGFYLLLALSVFNRRPWFMALGILLCLLSRYAFTFWLPVYMLIYWSERGFKNVFRVSMYVFVGVLALYIIPFLSQDWTILSKGLDYYKKTAVGQWQTQPWQAPGTPPTHLSNGLSMAMHFYTIKEYTVEDRLLYNRKVHMAACAAVALLLLLGYFLMRKRGLNVRIYLLVGLKFYLVIFYGFFYVPFSYLYLLPLFMTLPLIYHIPLFLPVGKPKLAAEN